MANIRSMLTNLLGNNSAKTVTPPVNDRLDRIHYDLVGASEADSMWYYERRRWRGRD